MCGACARAWDTVKFRGAKSCHCVRRDSLRDLFTFKVRKMFSKDPQHYHFTPRSLQQSKFGPYSKLTPIGGHRHEKLWAAVGVVVLGVIFGAMAVAGWL